MKNKYDKSICNKCNSCAYCRNASNGMMACVNFNKFPKEHTDDAFSRNNDR